MKRAAFLIHGPLSVIGGVERFNRYLLEFLKEKRFQVDLFEPSTVEAPTVVRRFAPSLVQFYYVGREARRRLKDYDLIITTGFTGGVLRGSNVVNISFGSVRSYFSSRKGSLNCNWKGLIGIYLSILFDRLSRVGKLNVVISPQVKDELIKDYGRRSVVVPCGIDTRHFSRHDSGRELRERYGLDPHTLVGAFVGRWDIAHKGLDILIPIMRERTDVHWLIAPDCDVALKGVRKLTVLRNVGYQELPAVYSAADFSIQLSRYESFGFSFIESLSCSVPVISTPVGIATQLYDDPLLCDLLVQHKERSRERIVADVHNKITSLQDKHYRESLAVRGRAKVEKDFSLELWRQRMSNVFQSVMRGTVCMS